jgi:hypothetical protein
MTQPRTWDQAHIAYGRAFDCQGRTERQRPPIAAVIFVRAIFQAAGHFIERDLVSDAGREAS